MPSKKIATFTVDIKVDNFTPEQVRDWVTSVLPAMLGQLKAATGHFCGKGFATAEISGQANVGMLEPRGPEPKCPGCGVGVNRPNCLFEMGGDCPRHEVRDAWVRGDAWQEIEAAG